MNNDELKKVIPLKNRDHSQIIEEIKEFASRQEFSTLDELNKKVAEFIKQKNATSNNDFLGLSPEQMNFVLYDPFTLTNKLFHFEHTDNSLFKEVPIVKQAIFILQKLNELGELKGTQRGNFPKNFVVEFYQLFLTNERYTSLPSKEDDLYQLTRLKYLLDLSGLIKRRNKKFSLTKKGQQLIEQNAYRETFEELILVWVNKLNWGISDGYQGLDFIQRSTIFNFFVIHKSCHDWAEEKNIAHTYLKAFPHLVSAQVGRHNDGALDLLNCFSLRFLERFCLPLGLLEQKTEGRNFTDRKTFYRVTPLFKNHFKFIDLK